MKRSHFWLQHGWYKDREGGWQTVWWMFRFFLSQLNWRGRKPLHLPLLNITPRGQQWHSPLLLMSWTRHMRMLVWWKQSLTVNILQAMITANCRFDPLKLGDEDLGVSEDCGSLYKVTPHWVYTTTPQPCPKKHTHNTYSLATFTWRHRTYPSHNLASILTHIESNAHIHTPFQYRFLVVSD